MSTILKALKKSEQQSQQSHPMHTLNTGQYTFPMEEDKPAWPYWMLVMVFVAGLSLAAGWLLLDRGTTPELSIAAQPSANALTVQTEPTTNTVQPEPTKAPPAVVKTVQRPVLQPKSVPQEVAFLANKTYSLVALPKLEPIKVNVLPDIPERAVTISLATKQPSFNKLDLSEVSQDLASKFQHAIAQTDLVEKQTEVVKKNDSELDFSGVSPEIAARYQKALSQPIEPVVDSVAPDAIPIEALPEDLKVQIPAMSYSSHMYSTNKDKTWIRINGIDLKEGDVLFDGALEILRIQPNHTIMRLDKQSFSLESLQDWQGG